MSSKLQRFVVGGRNQLGNPAHGPEDDQRRHIPSRAHALDLKLPTKTHLGAHRSASPKTDMPPPERPTSGNRGRVQEQHCGPLSASSYPSSTNGSSTESNAPRANSQKQRARGNPEAHEVAQLAAGPSSDDVEDSGQEEEEEEEEEEHELDTQGSLNAESQQSYRRNEGTWPEHTDGYDSNSNMDNEDDTIRRSDFPYVDSNITDPMEIARMYKGDLYRDHQLAATSRQHESIRQQAVPPQQNVAQQQQVGQQSRRVQQMQQEQQPTQPHGNARQPDASRQQKPHFSAGPFTNGQETMHDMHDMHDGMRKLLSPVTDECTTQPPVSPDLPNRTPWATNMVNGHLPEKTTLQTVPHKRRALDADYSQEALRSMKYEDLAAESFDRDPSAPTTTLDIFDKSPLSERLSHMLRRQPPEQGQFLASLSLQQWQDSGKWFEQEFAELNKRMMRSRSKRREICGRFENDIEKRYNEVMKESSVYKTALNGMVSSGQSVITQGTPRRKK